MKIKEQKGLITTKEDGASILNICSKDMCPTNELAKSLEDTYQIRDYVRHSCYLDVSSSKVVSISNDSILCLIVADNHYSFYNYGILQIALLDLKDYVIEHKIKKLLMPMIGCDKNGLDYSAVKEMLIWIFEDTDIEVEVRDPRFMGKDVDDESN